MTDEAGGSPRWSVPLVVASRSTAGGRRGSGFTREGEVRCGRPRAEVGGTAMEEPTRPQRRREVAAIFNLMDRDGGSTSTPPRTRLPSCGGGGVLGRQSLQAIPRDSRWAALPRTSPRGWSEAASAVAGWGGGSPGLCRGRGRGSAAANRCRRPGQARGLGGRGRGRRRGRVTPARRR